MPIYPLPTVFFVPEYISESDFYNHLVVIVNVLPGSILCKTLAGIGYLCGEAVVGTIAGGFAFAVAGFACSVACSCFVFYLVYHLYDRLEGCAVFKVIKKGNSRCCFGTFAYRDDRAFVVRDGD